MSGLPGRALLGWMDREQAIKLPLEDCVFSPPLSYRVAEEIWESRKAIVESLPEAELIAPARTLPMSNAGSEGDSKVS